MEKATESTRVPKVPRKVHCRDKVIAVRTKRVRHWCVYHVLSCLKVLDRAVILLLDPGLMRGDEWR